MVGPLFSVCRVMVSSVWDMRFLISNWKLKTKTRYELQALPPVTLWLRLQLATTLFKLLLNWENAARECRSCLHFTNKELVLNLLTDRLAKLLVVMQVYLIQFGQYHGRGTIVSYTTLVCHIVV